MRYLMMTMIVALLLAACGDAAEDSGIEPAETTVTTPDGGESTTPAPGESQPAADPASTAPVTGEEASDDDKQPEAAPDTEREGDVVADAVPEELMANIKADVATRTTARVTDMTLVRAEQAVWNDGSLGCAMPGESYTQAIVNGYWIVFELAGETYDYRASSSGFFKLCEGGGAPPSNPTG